MKEIVVRYVGEAWYEGIYVLNSMPSKELIKPMEREGRGAEIERGGLCIFIEYEMLKDEGLTSCEKAENL